MPGPETAPATDPPPRKRWAGLRTVLAGILTGLALAAAGEAARVVAGNNFHTVLPGRVYRCAQLSGPALERIVRAHGIRTVVNLRGCGVPWPWYLDEVRVGHRAGIAQEDVCLSAGRLPSAHELRRLVEVLDRTEYPILLHCRHGADRTGLAAVLVVLLQTDAPYAEGRRQLGLRYGHVPLGQPAYLDRFFELYEGWLREQRATHSPARLRQWLVRDYCPGECRCEIAFSFRRAPGAAVPALAPGARRNKGCLPIPRGEPVALRFRARNTGNRTWHLQPETNAGIHARAVVWNDHDQQVANVRAGLFEAEVPPGRAIELTLALPPLRKAGRYRLLLDMVDERQCWFFQTGSEPLETELEVVQ